MPVYFFDLLNADKVFADEEGTELSCISDVETEAAYALSDMLRDDARAITGYPTARELIIVVRDADGPVLEAKYSFQVTRLQ